LSGAEEEGLIFINPKGVELGSKCGKVPWACPWGFHIIR